MEIRNGAEDLRSLLGLASTQAPLTPRVQGETLAAREVLADDRATLSGVAAEVSKNVVNEGVRADKVAEVQASLAAGTYQVPPRAVASKLMEAMSQTVSIQS
jgi:anti-sigma28 factor (negative regulator of flagellin synthesis)